MHRDIDMVIRRAADSGAQSQTFVRMAVRADQARDDDRSMPVVVATEKAVLGFDRSWNLVDQVLLMDKANLPTDSVSLIDSHDSYSVKNVLGSVRDWAIEGSQLVGRMYFSDSADGQTAYRNYKAGHLNDVSIRAYATDSVLRIEPGKKGTVNGRTFSAGARPMDVFVRWSVYEVSCVVKGADVDAKVRRAAELEGRGMTFEQWLAKRGLDPAKLDEAKRASLHAEFLAETEAARSAGTGEDGQPAQPAHPAGDGQAQRAAVDPAEIKRLVDAEVARALADAGQAETKRVAKIREICNGEFPELENKAIAERWDEHRAATEVLGAVRKRLDSGVGSPAVIVKGGSLERGLVIDALRVRIGHGNDIVREDKDRGEERANRADEFRHISLLDVCRHALRLDGREVPNRQDDLIRAAATTISLPYILGNVANKSVMKGYNATPATWREWCSIGSEKDFKQATKVRLTDSGDLEEVTQTTGEIKHGTNLEEYEQYSLARYAKKQVISEVNIINDDLDLLSRVPQGMGTRAASLISKLVYTHLLANGNMTDGNALFSSAHSNLQSGAAYALSTGAAAIRKALELLRKQTDKDGESIEIDPRVVLACPEDEEYARTVLAGIRLAEGTTAGVATAVAGQIYGTMGMRPVVENRLSNTAYTGYSTTAWFLIGDPNQVDTVQVAFLNGQQTPRLETFNQQQMGIDFIGVGYRVIMDAVAKALDWRGMVKMTGTG